MEEIGLFGARALRQHLEHRPLRLVIVFETMACTRTERGSQQLPPGIGMLLPRQVAAIRKRHNRGDFTALLYNRPADARTATEQALGRLQSLGAPPVENGQQVLDDLRAQLTDLRTDLADARSRLDQADQNDVAAVGNAIVAAGNVVGAIGNSAEVLGILETHPQLDPAAEQASACQDLAESNRPTGSAPTS